jgi:hypothetical protein
MNYIENEHIKFWVENTILCSEYKSAFDMNLENSKEIYAMRKQISEGINQYFLYDISNLKSMTKEARDYGEKHGLNDLAASAVIVNSSVKKLMYNAFLKLKKVNIPVQAFSERELAIQWLHNIKELNGTI